MSNLVKEIGIHGPSRPAPKGIISLVIDLSQSCSSGREVVVPAAPQPKRSTDSQTVTGLSTTLPGTTTTNIKPISIAIPSYSMATNSMVENGSTHPPMTPRKEEAGGVSGGSGSDSSSSPSPPIQMSLVSPPFTPTDSQHDLPLEVPNDLSLGSKAAEQVASKLEEQLPQVFCESRARIPTTNGEEIFLHVYSNNVDTKEHLAIVFGQNIHSKTLFAPRSGETEHDRMTRGAYTGKLYPGRHFSGPDPAHPESYDEPVNSGQDVLCRIHSECYTGETAWSARCDCGEQLDEAARQMSLEGRGCIVYLRQEGRGIGLGEKLKAYNLQDLGADTVQANLMLRHPADGRSFGLATAILLDLGLDHIRLMTNNPDKIVAVEGRHREITVTQRVPMVPLSWQKKGGFQSAEVDKYLATKIERMGHLLQR